MPLITWVVTTQILIVTPLLPSPHDKDGWGLRIYQFDSRGPFLQCESLDQFPCSILLRNFSSETRETDRLFIALRTDALRLTITGPDGKQLPRDCAFFPPRDPFTELLKLKAGSCDSGRFRIGGFGYNMLFDTGRYRMQATLTIDGKTVTSPPIEFEVVPVPDDAVLVSHTLPLEGEQLTRPIERRHRVVIQQIKAGNRVWLVHRTFIGTETEHAFAQRIIELPGKCEMKVEGAYGSRKPLTITYKTSPTAESTKLVINSSDGEPWTEEDEKALREREKPLPPAKP
jgi:hypothetical protein